MASPPPLYQKVHILNCGLFDQSEAKTYAVAQLLTNQKFYVGGGWVRVETHLSVLL